MNPVHLSVKERMNEVNQSFGMRKKQLHLSSTLDYVCMFF